MERGDRTNKREGRKVHVDVLFLFQISSQGLSLWRRRVFFVKPQESYDLERKCVQ